VAIAGNPNTGKTSLFNALTGARAKVGNYPGVTVERHEGLIALGGPRGAASVRIADVPGTYSLSARSHEEALAIAALAGVPPYERPDCLVVTIDATQLARNLYLVLQVLELGIPTVVAVTMLDLLEPADADTEGGRAFDRAALERELGVACVPVTAASGRGLGELRDALAAAIDAPGQRSARGRPGPRWRPEGALAADVEAVAEAVPAGWHAGDRERARAFALWALLSAEDAAGELAAVPRELCDAARERRALAEAAGRAIDHEIIAGRWSWIEAREQLFLGPSSGEREAARGAADRSVADGAAARGAAPTERIDRVLLHPWIGFALFLALMTLVFQALFSGAEPAITAIELAVSWLAGEVRALVPAGILADLFADGLVAGVGAVVAFLPQILLLFLFIGILEDTGYMARVAFIMDRVMRLVGLHGRAFVPMLSGYACAVPAILAARTLERRRDRLLTMMVVPLMSCSARLPVYGLLIAALASSPGGWGIGQGLLLAAMYLFSTLVALVAGSVLGRTVLRGPRVPLILEMPLYRRPHWPSVARLMLDKTGTFLREAGTSILLITLGMWALLAFPRDRELTELGERRAAIATELDAESAGVGVLAALRREDESLAEREARARQRQLDGSFAARAGKLCEPLLEPLGFDWKIGVGLLGAFAAREVFVSTMGVVYGAGSAADEDTPRLREALREERRPDGSLVFTPLACLSLMVFFAIACQCSSTLVVVRRETRSWRWPAFLFAYTGALAWAASFAVFQGGKLLGFA
jgi:ferrous iron transport protein B